MKDILLKITGKTVSSMPKMPEDSPEDKVEFITGGTLVSRGNISFIKYEESELSGMPGCKTSLTITPRMVKLKREGEAIGGETVMVFEEGKHNCGIYETPMGAIEMELLTDKIIRSEATENPKVFIEYSISLKGLMEARKELNIEVINKN